MTQERLHQLARVIGQAERVLILPHNNPDPDAIASAVALRYLLAEKFKVEAHLLYQGIIARAENRAMVRYLNHPLQLLTPTDLARSLPVILVDTQPGAGNNPAPPEDDLIGVIDHHTPIPLSRTGPPSRLRWTDAVPPEGGRLQELTPLDPPSGGRLQTDLFVDIRVDVGATSTILTNYLRVAEIELSTPLITALFYGIKTNTLGLGRNSGPMDMDAYYYLQPRIDVDALAKIENARVPPHYFKSFDLALRSAYVYEGVVIAFLGEMIYPDLAAEMADLLLRLEEARWVICLGVYQTELILSVRTRRRIYSAEELIQAVIGAKGTAGGHGTIAGGQIPLAGQETGPLVEQLTAQILQHLNIPEGTKGKSLI